MIRWVLVLLVCTAFSVHKFYFSNTEIFHNMEHGTLEVTMRLFTDDLERAIAGEQAGSMRLGDEHENPRAQQLVEEYVLKKFKLGIAGDPLELAFVGKEVEMDITWIYLESPSLETLSGLEVKSAIFTELFPDQVNEIRFQSGEQRTSIQLTRDQNKTTLHP